MTHLKLFTAYLDTMRPLSADTIERIVERRTDKLDARYMTGEITTEQYESACDEINAWADAEYNWR
jgi:hypothetical protein